MVSFTVKMTILSKFLFYFNFITFPSYGAQSCIYSFIHSFYFIRVVDLNGPLIKLPKTQDNNLR